MKFADLGQYAAGLIQYLPFINLKNGDTFYRIQENQRVLK